MSRLQIARKAPGALATPPPALCDTLIWVPSYNPAGQIASTTRSNDAYAWNGSANRNDASTLNGLNQATAVGATSIGHDGRGNVTGIGLNSYGYSSENLLLTGPAGASLTYDPLTRLYQESGSSVAATRFLYDGQALVGEYDGSGALRKRYVHGPGSGEPLVEYGASGARTWLHADERGSVIARSDDGGVASALGSYDEYGMPGSGNVGRFGYTGQAWLPSLGMWYYKARMYNPSGRFLQVDPIGYADGMNGYGYVGGDPVNATDPSGLMIDDVVVTGPRIRPFPRPFPSTFPLLNIVSPIALGSSSPFSLNDADSADVVVHAIRPKPRIAVGRSLPKNGQDGDTRCYANAKHFADQLQNVGNGLQTVGKVITGIGLVGDAAAIFFPPAELVTGGFTALGAGINGVGNAISGAGGVLDFVATGNYQRAGLNAVGFVAGRLSSTGDAHQLVRGIALDAAVNGKQIKCRRVADEI